MRLRFITYFFVTIFWTPLSIFAQFVSVGHGSYTTQFPGTDAAGRNGFITVKPQLSGAALNKPVPTNDWWSKQLVSNHADNLFNYPFAMRTQPDGLVVNYIPWGPQGDAQSIIVGTSNLNAESTTVSNHSDWTVTMDWNNDFSTTAGIGMPFLYFEKSQEETVAIQVMQGSVSINKEMIIVTNAGGGANYVIYAPAGSVWEQNGNMFTSDLNGKNYWSLAMLPQGENNIATIAEEYKSFAYTFPVNTIVEWSFDESTSIMRTNFIVETVIKEGTNKNTLIGLLPHQWDNLAADSPEPQGYSYQSVRGELKMLEATSFSVENTFYGILPTLPYLANSSESFSLPQLDEKVKLLENDQLDLWTDSYNEGQLMNRLIQTARIADKMGNIDSRNKMLATIKQRLEDWLTAEGGEIAFLFYYQQSWSTMIGYPAGHGQDTNINDHHFHWGYFIHAAAFLEQFEPGWSKDWGEMINLLVRDAASPSRADDLFPFLRNFSPYAGHCWANGTASFPQGNDQESTSESMQFNSSLIHWGEVTGDKEIRDLGIYLYTTEQSAIEEYWFDIKERIFPENQYSVVSRVWGNSYDNGTFFTADIAASYGIELYPIHGGSTYLGHNVNYAEKVWAEIEAFTGILSNEVNPNLWHDIMYQYVAFTDPEKAIELYNSNPDRNLKFGVSDAQTYYWIHSMNALGYVNASITADYPIAAVFTKEDQNTYVAHNYADSAVQVHFSNGYTLDVPARSMRTNRDVDITGEITSSFETAFAGGSVELMVETTGGTPTKVEFYDDGVKIGEDLVAPYTFKAKGLTPKIHGFYAKIFVDEAFGVTDIAQVIVGEQVPYDAINQIPGTIEAGLFDRYEGGRGQGITYSDATINNNGDFRLEESVDVGLSNAEGAIIGWITSGEWVEYTVEVSRSGLYNLTFRYASDNSAGGGPFHMQLNDERITDDISLSSTSGWDEWQSKTVNDIAIPQGRHVLKLSFDRGEFNIARMTFSFSEDLPYGHPIANAGDNVVVVLPETMALLDGSQSTDSDGDILNYHWKQINGPSVISFTDTTIVNPQVSNLEDGVYTCRLTVDDGAYSSFDDVLIIVSETGNSAPSVTITSPANNASFREGEDLTIIANATDLEGEVSVVEFFDGSTSIGVDTTSPFEAILNNPAIGTHELTAIATDVGGASTTSEVVNITVNEVITCTITSSDAQEGTFTLGYEATFESVGENVSVTFELRDTDKTGVVAFLWEADPFQEVQMETIGSNLFRGFITGKSVGDVIRVACKFAFTGGQVVTKYLEYQIGDDCSSEQDNSAPINFTASVGTVTFSSVELLLNASDQSGKIVYEVTYGSQTASFLGDSEVVKSHIVSGLESEQTYTFTIAAYDQAGNSAANSGLELVATTLVNTSNECNGIEVKSQQGSFETGYAYSFETIGTEVHITFELLDDKNDVIAFLWEQSPFTEQAMERVSGNEFKTILSDHPLGSELNLACKFAFNGGLAVSEYFNYTVGERCEEGGDSIITFIEKPAAIVYPNPVENEMTIHWPLFQSGALYDVSGKQVMTFSNTLVSMINVEKGTYILQLLGKNNEVKRLRIIHQ